MRGSARDPLHHVGRPGRAIAFALCAIAACSGAPRDPTRYLQPGDGTGQVGTGGGHGALVGSWQAVIVLAVEADVQRWTTTWRFDADGGCHFRREVFSVTEGIPRSVERGCAWTVSGATIQVTFSDTGERYPLPWSFASFGTTTLLLEGLAYQRVAG